MSAAFAASPEDIPEVGQLLRESASRVIEPNISVIGKELLLPFEQMDEYDFERLCTRLAPSQSDVQGARRYGTRGEAQYGIDIYARWRGKDGYCVYQCKRYQAVTPAVLTAIIQKFVEDCKKPAAPQWLQKATAFVLCITQPLEKARFTDAVENAYQGLSGQLGLDVWDTVRLTELLKERPDIVEEFFGRTAAERLCGRGSLLEIRARLDYDPEVTAPSQLLIASNRVVPFAGRDATVQELEQWCAASPLFAAKLISGAGGVGKTRLMLEFATAQRQRGWLTGFTRATDDRNEQPLEWQALLERDLPTLIVIDYAESRKATIEALLEAAEPIYQKRSKPIRLMLLARGGDEWWTELKRNPMLGRATTLALPAAETLSSPEQRREEFERAVKAFSQALNTTLPTAPTSPNLEHPSFQRLLYVHMLALLECQGVRLNTADGEAVLEGTLNREREHWKKQLAHTPSLASAEHCKGVERTMTLVTLGYPVAGLDAATTLIRRDPVLGSDLDQGSTRFLAGRLQTTYPGRDYINPIEPDLLAEHLIYTQLTHPDTGAALIETAFGEAGASAGTASVNLEPALAHLVRLAEWQPGAVDLWRTVFSGRLNNVAPNDTDTPLLLTAMQLARGAITTKGSELGDLLAELLEASDDTVLAMQAEAMLPDYSVSLLKFTEVVRRMAVVVSNEEQRLTHLGNHAKSLSHLGSYDLALQKISEVILGYRNLTEKNSKVFLPSLAAGFNNQSVYQNALGDHAAALESIAEAVEIFRELTFKDRDAFLPNLGASLNNQSRFQIDSGNQNSALEIIMEAEEIYRELVSKDQDAFLPDLAASLNNQNDLQSAFGDDNAALETITEAVEIRRALVSKNRDAFLPDLAASLNNQSNRQSDIGDHNAALETITEAVKIFRELASKNRNAFLPSLAASLKNQGDRQSNLSNNEAALEAAQESVAIYRELQTRTSGAFNLKLADAINLLSGCWQEHGQNFKAARLAEEAVMVLKPVFQAYPQTVRDQMQHYVRDYLNRCKAAELEPDSALVEELNNLLFGDDSSKVEELDDLFVTFSPLIVRIAMVAMGNKAVQAEIEETLSTLEGNGWHLSDALERIWAGERDPQSLTAGLNIQEAALIRYVLELI